MTWPTLAVVQLATRIEFTKKLASAHHFVRLVSGRWTRTLGAPGPCLYDGVRTCTPRLVRGRVWHMVAQS
jgi:hypothetical protein